MPVLKRREEVPSGLRPYVFHGVDLAIRGSQANGDCPFCGKAGKFTAQIDTGLWRCFVCGGGTDSGGGNALTFLRQLHTIAAESTPALLTQEVVRDRRLLGPIAVIDWGVVQSPIDRSSWLIPGYAVDGTLAQLYNRARINDSWRLLPTPGIWPDGKVHALHLAPNNFDPKRETIIICEGPWDAMALYEMRDELLREFGNCQIVAVPGCNVWRDEWSAFCRGKRVILLYDNDHPRIEHGKEYRSGYDGMRRVARQLNGCASSVQYLKWGEDGYDPELPDGYDVRDALSGVGNPPHPRLKRTVALTGLLLKVEDAPQEWFSNAPSSNGKPHTKATEAQECHNWRECEDAWKEAMRWRQDLSDALAVLLAVCASTKQGGNQLFLQLVGSAGSGKTTMCDGLLVSHHCHHLEHLTGFFSGWKKKDDSDKDCSLIARINGKTLVTPEADVLVSSPKFTEIMGQQRRIFDGKSASSFKNSDEDRLYDGLRTPWIMAGTPAMMDHDQSHLGDRFLRFIIDDPNEDEKRSILRSALRSERAAILDSANGTAASLVDPKLRKAHALTGGYVNWLRANAEELIARVERNVSDAAEDRCIDLAMLSADLRARPNTDKRKQETHDSKELPTRLARQNVRLAVCLAAVFNKPTVDAEVLRIVRKVALDTAYGHSLNVVKWLCSPAPRGGGWYQEQGGIPTKTLETWLGMPEERLENYLVFLRKMDVLRMEPNVHGISSWLLTDRVYNLYLRIWED